MKSLGQIYENIYAMIQWDSLRKDFQYTPLSKRELRTCHARLHESGDVTWLESFGSIVACYNSATDELFNLSQYYQFGYIASTAEHIKQFIERTHPRAIYTYRPV